MMEYLLMFLLFIVAVFMILLVLIQRGRGGGLVGAFGGMGGQSAFGTKAGDLFTRITMWSAFVWIVLCAITTKYLNDDRGMVQLPGQAPPAGRGENIGLPRGADAQPAETTTPDEKAAETKPAAATGDDGKSNDLKPSTPAATESTPAPTTPTGTTPADTKPDGGKS